MIRKDPLLVLYPIRIREITISVVLGLTLIFYFFPRFLDEGKVAEYSIVEEIETFDIPQTQQIKLPEPPPRPSIPIASDDEFLDEDITIEETDFDDFEEWDAPPPPPSSGPMVQFNAYDKPPQPRTPIRPIYPEIAREAGIEGTVQVQFYVYKSGYVAQSADSIWTLRGIPNTGLDEAAIEAIKKTRWKPAKQRDKKVGVWIAVPINFKLTSG